MPALPGPVSESERVTSLDVLRGCAVLGILLVNITSFAMPGAAFVNPTALGTMSRADWATWLACHVLAEGKFITLFSMLFGAGILLFVARTEARGERVARLHYRRMFWLLLFGIAHAYLLWSGDILFTYAICGMLVYPLRRLPPRKLFVTGFLVFGVSTAINLFLNWSLPHWPSQTLAEVNGEYWRPARDQIAAELRTYRSGWLTQMPDRVAEAWFLQGPYLLMNVLWYVAGLMLIGMAMFRWGVITGERSRRFYQRMILFGALAGLPLIVFGVYRNFQAGWSIRYSLFAGTEFNSWGSLGLAAAYMGGAVLMSRTRRPGWLVDRLAAVGRMAFTNYILQSLLCTTLFYGHGLGLFGRLSRVGQLAVVGGVWMLQLAWSPAWLRRFSYGPLEWLWRSLTYGVRQPFRRVRLSPAGRPVPVAEC